MHNHVDHRWIKAFLRKIISILLVYSLFFTSTANAANVGGWTMSNPIAKGASTVYTGTKNVIINGADYIKTGTAKITPPVSAVSKVLARGVAGYALSVAVEQLLGSVDWVLDPANNRIKYVDPSAPVDPNDPTLQYFYRAWSGGSATAPILFADGSSPQAACSAWFPYLASKGIIRVPGKSTDSACIDKDGNYTAGISRVANPAYDPNAQPNEDREKSIPLDVVAQQVISNANSGDAAAQQATTAAAADIVAEAETDDAKARPIAQQLEASSTTKPADEAAAEKANEATGEQTKNPDKPDTTDLKLTFPVFCGWAPLVCEAAQTVISFPTTLTDWWNTTNQKADSWASSIAEAWTSVKEWAKNDENEDTDNDPPEIQEIDIGALDTSTFQGVAGCPAPIQIPITFGTGGETEISYEPICQLADKWSFVAPLIGFLSGAMILVGVGRKGEDGEI